MNADWLAADVEDARLAHLLHATLSRHGTAEARGPAAPLPPAFFGLDRVERVRDAGPDAALAIARRCSDALLDEALYIERVGVGFAARMSLLAESNAERSLYAMFAADEAMHLAWLGGFRPDAGPPSAFHQALHTLAATGDRRTLQFVVQIVLEGWGIRHYRSLAEATPDAALAAVLRRIVDDEAHHHGAGVLLFHRQDGDDGPILDALRPFLAAVRQGPTSVISAIDAELGPTTPDVHRRTHAALAGEAHAAARLGLLRGLMRGARSQPILDALDAERAFDPDPAEQVYP